MVRSAAANTHAVLSGFRADVNPADAKGGLQSSGVIVKLPEYVRMTDRIEQYILVDFLYLWKQHPYTENICL